MKKSEQAMIIFIAVISLMIAYAIGNAVFGKSNEKGTTIKTAQQIQASVDTPDSSSPIFNKNNINPAVQIEITAAGASSDSSDSGQ